VGALGTVEATEPLFEVGAKLLAFSGDVDFGATSLRVNTCPGFQLTLFDPPRVVPPPRLP
jgi:hypothetical protein